MRFKCSIVFALSLSFCAVLSGCVKKRPTMEGQGENLKDLVSIHDLTSTTCEIRTKDVRQRVFSSQAKVTSIETTGAHGIKNLDIVNFETSCPYLSTNLKNIELLALPNTKIPARFEINASTVILYKIVEKNQLSHLESPYAIKEGDRYKVPVGGFEISGFYNIENERNADNRETNVQRKIGVSADNFRQAGYLTFSRDAFKSFTHLPKKDVYPKEYFEGEWHYAATVVNVRHNSGDHPGRLIEEDSARNRASRVRFRMEGKYLIAENQNVDDRLRDSRHELNMNYTLQIPMKNVDFRARPQGAGISLEEEEIATKQPEETRYVELKLDESEITDPDYSSALSAFFDLLKQKSDKSIVLSELTIRDDYFSFLLENREHNEVIRYAFMRVKSKDEPLVNPYKPRIAFKSDMDRFGYFTVRKDQIWDNKVRTQADVESLTFLERFHPERDIVYHFSKNTPKTKWIRDIGREAVSLWDQAFQKAGLKIHMRLDESEDVDLGDLRFNVLNFVGDLTGGLIGYGPVIADAKSGEILSGTTNLFIENYKQVNISQMRAYVAEKIGQRFRVTEPGNLTQPLTHMNPGLESLLAGEWIREPGSEIKFAALHQWRMGASPYTPTPVITDEEIRSKTSGRWSSAKDLISAYLEEVRAGKRTQTLSNAMDQTPPPATWAQERYIETAPQCQAIRNLISKYNQSGLPSTEEFLDAVEPCVIPFTQIEGLSATVHEIGHNLGLLHNFMGSKDKANFASADSYKLKLIDVPKDLAVPRSSSIMDYFGGEAGFQFYPGPYDIAAIRFGYLDQVEEAGGMLVKFDTGRELGKQLSVEDSHPFLYCSDIHRYFRSDVFCKAHDIGTTATEGVVTRVSELYRSLSMMYRYQTAYEIWDWYYMNHYWNQALYDFKTYYDQWRLLVAQEVGERKKYLQGVTEEEYAQIVDRMLKSEHKAEVEDFLKARNVIVQSLIDFVFLPNRYCVVLNDGGEKSFIELSYLRNELQRMSVYGRIDSCRHPAVVSRLSEQKLKLLDEVGFDLEGGSYENSPIAGTLAYDFMGTAPIRLNSAILLTVHGTLSEVNALQDFFPSMMDEPDIRRVVTELWRYRILKGNFISVRPKHVEEYAQARLLNVNDQMSRTHNNNGGPELQVNYAAESTLLEILSTQIALAHYVPGDVPETINRIGKFQVSVYPTSEERFYKPAYQYNYELDKKVSLGVTGTTEDSYAAQMIVSLQDLTKKKAAISMAPEAFIRTADALIEAFEKRKLLPPEDHPTNYDFCRLNRIANQNLQAAQATGQKQNESVIELLLETEKSATKDIMKQMEADLAMQGYNAQALDFALKAHEVFDNAMTTINSPDERDSLPDPGAELVEKALDMLAAEIQKRQMSLDQGHTLYKRMIPEQKSIDVIADGALELLAEAAQSKKITIGQARLLAKRIIRDSIDRSKPKPGEAPTFVPADKTRLEAMKKAFAVLDQEAMPALYRGRPGTFPNPANLHKRAELFASKIGAKRSEITRHLGEYDAHWNLITKILMNFTGVSL